jgi:hypothetical protein
MGDVHQFIGEETGGKILKVRVQADRVGRKRLQDPLFDLSGFKTTNYSVPNHSTHALGTEIHPGVQIQNYRFFVDYFTYNISISNPIEYHSSDP